MSKSSMKSTQGITDNVLSQYTGDIMPIKNTIPNSLATEKLLNSDTNKPAVTTIKNNMPMCFTPCVG